VVADIDADDRFSPWTTPWAEALRASGCSSVVVVPLHLGAEVIGILAAAFTWTGGLDEEDLTFLEAYAEQASAVIVLARAFERERAVAVERAEANRLKSEFLSVVSHELRTPLTAVKGFVDTVLLHWDRLPDERRRELLERASANGDELARLVGQLLDFARIDANRVQMHPTALDVRALIATVADDLAPVLAHHDLEVDVPAGLRALADADAFEHVLVNLLTNAVKFSPKGARVRVVGSSVVLDDDVEEVIVSVSDEGVGIAPADQERIFERFYQAEGNELSRRGTGIGLTIARRFAELQGGRLWLESTPGVGTTFSFSLPTIRSAPEPDVGPAADSASRVVVEAGAGLTSEPAGGDQLS
jgi:signal transduction histidine kinase